MYPSAGLVRSSTVGGPAPVSTWIRAAPRPARPRAEPEASPPGLEEFLQRLHLASYTEAVKVWCEEQGACELSELVENAEDLAKTLRFPPNKAQEIKVKGPAFVKAIEKPKISKAISAPPAALAPPAPTRVLGQLGADVLRAAFMPKALEMKEENAAKPGLASTDRTETDLWDEREARCHLQAMQDPCLFYSAEVPDDSLKKFSGERYYYRGYVEPHLLRQRNPTEAELKVKERASAEAKEQLDAAWGDVADSPPSMPRAQQRAQAARHAAFEEIRQEFLSQFEGNLQQELGKGYKLTPADVHPRVKEKFVEESKSLGTGALDYGYHGTRQANIPSILGTGLKVPGNESGVRVANGSAHGVGIYTGMPGNLWISQNFSDSKNMLICGVLDPDAPPRPKVAMPSQAAVTTTTQRLKATHRPHRRPVVAAAAAPPPAPVFSCTEFRTNDEIKVVGAARVIFKEERVAPLFIAQPAASDRSFTYQEATPGSEPLRGGSKGQVYIPESGEVVWDCWEPTGGAYGRRLKRRVVQKERQQERASLRLLKRTEQEAS